MGCRNYKTETERHDWIFRRLWFVLKKRNESIFRRKTLPSKSIALFVFAAIVMALLPSTAKSQADVFYEYDYGDILNVEFSDLLAICDDGGIISVSCSADVSLGELPGVGSVRPFLRRLIPQEVTVCGEVTCSTTVEWVPGVTDYGRASVSGGQNVYGGLRIGTWEPAEIVIVEFGVETIVSRAQRNEGQNAQTVVSGIFILEGCDPVLWDLEPVDLVDLPPAEFMVED